MSLKSLIRKAMSFASVGMICTGIGLSLNFILLRFFETPLRLTYFCVYSLNTLLSYYLNTHFTFKAQRTSTRLIAYYGIYLSAMGVGLGMLTLYKLLLPFPNWVFPFMVVPVTMTWNFLWSSLLLDRKASREENP